MRNTYRFAGDDVLIRVRCCNTGEWFETAIDIFDLMWVNSYTGTWYAALARKSTTKRYVFAKKWLKDERRTTTISMHRLIMGYPDHDVNHLDNDGLNNRRSNLNTLTHIDNIRYHWPDRDWTTYDAVLVLAEEYRQEREIARNVQTSYNLTRQQLWKIRTGITRGNGWSKAAVAYHDAIRDAGIRPFELLKRENPRDAAQWGAVMQNHKHLGR